MTDTLRKAAEYALTELEADGVYGLDNVAAALRTALAEKPVDYNDEYKTTNDWLCESYAEKAESTDQDKLAELWIQLKQERHQHREQIAELEETLRLQRNSALADRAQITKLEQKLAIAEKALGKANDAYGVISDGLQSDLENGVKWLNKAAAQKFNKEYPGVTKALDLLLDVSISAEEALVEMEKLN